MDGGVESHLHFYRNVSKYIRPTLVC